MSPRAASYVGSGSTDRGHAPARANAVRWSHDSEGPSCAFGLTRYQTNANEYVLSQFVLSAVINNSVGLCPALSHCRCGKEVD